MECEHSDENLSTGLSQSLFIFQNEEHELSSEEPPPEEWSSYDMLQPKLKPVGKKSELYKQGLYSPGSGEVCAKYIRQSDSDMLQHQYYKYPSVLDPGIEAALFEPSPHKYYEDQDGIQLYKDLCEKYNEVPIRLFYSNLKKPAINLKYYAPSYGNVGLMAAALERNAYVKRYDLTDNHLDRDACYHLGKMLKENSTLEELILDGCHIRDAGLFQLGADLDSNYTLKMLSLARNELQESGGRLLAEIVEGAHITHLNLSNNGLGPEFCSALADTLKYRNDLIYLNLSLNDLGLPGPTAKLLNALAQSDVLKELDLSYTGLNGERVAKVVAKVTLIRSLNTLNLRSNLFDDTCAPIIVQNLKQSKLKTLDMSSNNLTAKGGISLLEAMRDGHVKLRNLFLDNICVSRPFLALLAKVRAMKNRKKFIVTYDRHILHDWVAIGEDPRKLTLRRGDYLGSTNPGKPKDVIKFLLALTYTKPYLREKEVVVMMQEKKIKVDDDWVQRLIEAFPGKLLEGKMTADAVAIRDMIRRLYPHIELPADLEKLEMHRVEVKNKKEAVRTSSEDIEVKIKEHEKEKRDGIFDKPMSEANILQSSKSHHSMKSHQSLISAHSNRSTKSLSKIKSTGSLKISTKSDANVKSIASIKSLGKL